MKNFFGFAMFMLIIVLTLLMIPMTAQVPMTCGSGIIQRADGSIIIDGFTLYPQPFPGSVPGQVLPNNEGKTKQGPTSIILGKTLVGETPICFEDNNGMKCIPLKTIKSYPTMK